MDLPDQSWRKLEFLVDLYDNNTTETVKAAINMYHHVSKQLYNGSLFIVEDKNGNRERISLWSLPDNDDMDIAARAEGEEDKEIKRKAAA